MTAAPRADRPLRVIHVVRQFAPMVGGLEEAVGQLARAQAGDPALAPEVVTLDRSFRALDERLPASETIAGVPVRRIPFRGSTRYPVAPGVLRAIAGADLVHVHAIDFFFDYLALTWPLHRRPLVASTHGGFFHTEFGRGWKPLFFRTVTRTSARAYRALFASSVNDAELFSRIAPGRVTTVENGVDIDKWRDAAARRPVRTLAAIGRFSENKRLEDLITTIAAARRRGDDWRLIVIGLESDRSAGDLRASAAAAGVADAVEIAVGLDSAAIGRKLSAASFIASASRFEGFGIAAVEGLSAGLIPLLSPIPPFRRLIAAAGLGTIIAFDDPERAAPALEQAFAALSADPDGLRARAIAAARPYSWSGAAATFKIGYEGALGRVL